MTGPRFARRLRLDSAVACAVRGLPGVLVGRVQVRLVGWILAVAVAVAVGMTAGCGGDAPVTARHNVLLITVDTLRADFVGSYGFSLPATPNMDALAERGLLFETAVAASTATAPSHASIMTSRFVREHSVGAHNGSTRLEDMETLADRFRDAGYDTAAFVSNVVLKRRMGFDRGFDVYDDELPRAERNREIIFERISEQTVGRALAWLAGRGANAATAPFFLWVHVQDPHGPYTPPEPFASLTDSVPLRTRRELPVLGENRGRGGIPRYQRVEGVQRADQYAARYAGEVAYTDHWIGELVAAVDKASEADGSVIVLTADHGESLDENGFFFQHGHSTTHEQAMVPLLLVAPDVEPRRVSVPVHHVDIAPTLIELMGLAPLPEARGISLLAAAAQTRDRDATERLLISDIGSELAAYGANGYLRVRVGSTGNAPASGEELALQWAAYERGEDGTWRKAPDPPRLPSAITEYLAAELPVVPAHAMSEGDIERLRALGYLPPLEDSVDARDGSGAEPGGR